MSIEKKFKIIHALNNGAKNKDLAAEYGVTHGAITRIKKNQEEHLRAYKNVKFFDGNTKMARIEAFDSRHDQVVYLWFKQKRTFGDPVTGALLKAKALQFHRQLYGETNFVASEGWLKNFKLRHGIKSLQVAGERMSANNKDADEFRKWFAAYIKKHKIKLENIYNADETGLYWRGLPRRTLITCNETNPAGWKVAKERVTTLNCANATGTHCIPLFVIGKSLWPDSFKKSTYFPFFYYQHPSAWMDRDGFTTWFEDIFVPAVKEHNPDPNEKLVS